MFVFGTCKCVGRGGAGPLRDGRVEKNMIDSRPLLSISRCRVVKKKVAFLSIFSVGGGGGGDLSDTSTALVAGFFKD